jgi:CheY-like chemotaxis protein
VHTVLVVDDSQESLDLARVLLRRRFRVMTATSAGGALGMARRKRPDVIVSDLRMPGVDGLQFARILRADPALSGIPLVATTAFRTEDADRSLVRDAGFDTFIPKPLDAGRFADELDDLLEPQDGRS